MKRNDENPAADDSLDGAIRDALRIELDRHEVANLELYWREQLRRDKWRRNAVPVITSAAATIAVVAGLILVRAHERDHEVAQTAEDSTRGAAIKVPVSLPRTADR